VQPSGVGEDVDAEDVGGNVEHVHAVVVGIGVVVVVGQRQSSPERPAEFSNPTITIGPKTSDKNKGWEHDV
jgi:hypothetical protein